jgi:ABC-type transport system involved in cytochrome c biogenesis ATPase subunit
MKVSVDNRCSDYESYRAARVKSLFNVETGCNFALDADLAIDDADWKVGVVVGPSGSGKTSIGRLIFPGAMYEPTGWPSDAPIIDAIAPGGDFNAVTGALAAVGLGSVPSWLRPYPVLSNGEKFRADLARVICAAPARVVVDVFTSVVDRQIAQIGALAFQKAWRRTAGQVVLLSCHYDILDWLEPDWIFDTATREFVRGRLRRRPAIDLDVWQTDWRYWRTFEPHHYLKMPLMTGAKCYVGTVDGQLVAHMAVASIARGRGVFEARACRLVIMPEWQGAGVGLRFLATVCERYRLGEGHLPRASTTLFHTSHPGLVAALRRDRKWRQVSAVLYGVGKARSAASIALSAKRAGRKAVGGGFGGHMRAVQGFRYVGAPEGPPGA